MAGAGCCSTAGNVYQGDIISSKNGGGSFAPSGKGGAQASTAGTGSGKLDFLMNLDQKNVVIAEYIWVDGAGELRAKSKTINRKNITNISQLPDWNYDGSSTYQAETTNSEIILKPSFYFLDPFRRGVNVMVLCETYRWADTKFTKLMPSNTNFRFFAKQIFDAALGEKPWYGIEQEYTLLDSQGAFSNRPHKWPKNAFPGAQGPYYCSVGGNQCFGRTVADQHYKCCLYAGIKISGTNGEVMPSQWEFQIGPSVGIDQGDHMWAARYLLKRVAEMHNLTVSFEPKIFKDWNGSGCHTNFSTEKMRKGTGGMQYIEDMMASFKDAHMVHMELYGEDNSKRLTGIHETSPFDQFSYGIGNRAASIRIPSQTFKDKGKGYIEDRRPASNIDPYIVSSLIFDTACLKGSKSKLMIDHYRAWCKSIPRLNIIKP